MRKLDEEIFAVNDAFSKAWNERDVKALAGFYAEDGLRVGAMGDVSRGRSEIEEEYRKLLTGSFAGAMVSLEKGTVRRLTRALAVWHGGMEIVRAGGGEPMKGYVVQVMRKEKGRWLILEAHPKFYPAHHTASHYGSPDPREQRPAIKAA